MWNQQKISNDESPYELGESSTRWVRRRKSYYKTLEKGKGKDIVQYIMGSWQSGWTRAEWVRWWRVPFILMSAPKVADHCCQLVPSNLGSWMEGGKERLNVGTICCAAIWDVWYEISGSEEQSEPDSRSFGKVWKPCHRITVLCNTYNVTPQVCDLFNYSLIVMIVNLYIVTSTKAQILLRASRHVCH